MIEINLAFSNGAKKRFLHLLFFLSTFFIIQTKPEEFPRLPVLEIAGSVIKYCVFFGLLYVFIKITQKTLSKPVIKENAAKPLQVGEDEKFFGELDRGFQRILSFITDACSITDPKEKREFFDNSHSNFIFYSSPGCGKNHSVKFLKHELDLLHLDIPFYSVGQVETAHVGAGANTLVEVFKLLSNAAHKSKNKMSVVVFDEFDSVAKTRSSLDPRSATTNQLLSLLDGFEKVDNQVKIVLIGLTNNISFIDDGVISRSEQFELKLTTENLRHIMREKFGEDFFDSCPLLQEAVDKGYLFGKTNLPISARDVDSIKKTVFAVCCEMIKSTGKKKSYTSFDKIPLQERINGFEQAFEHRIDCFHSTTSKGYIERGVLFTIV